MATSSDIALHYDNDSDFFENILGKSMCYTCADWHGVDTLDKAQTNKIDKILQFAGVNEATRSLIDLGCGWGGPLRHVSENYNSITDLRGVTISIEQAEYAKKYLEGTKCKIYHDDLFNYLKNQPDQSIDVAIMVGVIEHLVSPDQYRSDSHIEGYRNVLSEIHRVVKGNFSLQTIVAMQEPNALKGNDRVRALKFQRFISKYIFPNSLTPRDEYIREAVEGLYQIERFEVRSDEYQKTIGCWRDNLEAVKESVAPDQYNMFATYFDLCIEHFGSGYLGLARYALKPIR